MAGPAGGALFCGVITAVAGWLLRAWQRLGIPHIPHFSTVLGPWMPPLGGMDGWEGVHGVAGLAGAADGRQELWNSALDKRSVLPDPMSVSRVGYRVTEIPGTSGRCGSEGCSRRCCQCRGGAGTPGQLEGELAPCSGRLVAPEAALWEGRARERPRAGGAEEGSQPRGRGGGGTGPPGAGGAGYGQGAASGPGAGPCRSTARSRAWPGKLDPCGRRRGQTGLRGVLAGSVRVRAGGGGGGPDCAGPPGGDNETGRLRWGRVPPGPSGPAPAAPPRPRDSPAPPSRGVPVPPGAQRGPDPAAPGIDVLPPGRTVGLGLTRGLQWGGCPGARCAARGAAALVREGTGASPARSPSVSRAVGLGGSSHGNQPVKEPLVAMETGPGVTLAVALGAEGIQQLSRPPCGLWGHRAVGHEPWTRLCGAAA